MVAGPKAKSSAPNGAAPKGAKSTKAKAASPRTSGAATPLNEEPPKAGAGRVSKPDKAAYDAEQEVLRQKIAELQEKMNVIQNKINAGSNAGPGAERRKELREEFDKIRNEQGKFKTSRGQLIAQLKTLNENISKKVKDLQAAKSKAQFKSVADVDAHIKHLEKQVESGTMKLVDEKRALAEISSCKRLRKTVENFQSDQDAIERDRAQVEELQKQLNDPESRALSERAEAIKEELDQIKKEGDEFYGNRNKLFDERNELKREIDEPYKQKKESAQRFREENDTYWAQVHTDRARRAERAKAQRQAEEEEKRKEQAQRMREEAALPAYQSEIEDCQTLIDYFSGKTTGAIRLSTSEQLTSKVDLAGVPKLDIRRVEANTAGLVARKKKNEEEEAYFVGGKGRKGGKKAKSGVKSAANGSGADGDATPTASSPSSGALNVPLPTLKALLGLSIPPPVSAADVPRTKADLQTKKAWFEANQARATQEKIAKVEADIQRLLGISTSKQNASTATSSSSSSIKGIDTPPNGTGEDPAEPTPTPADAANLERPVSPEDVEAELEEEVSKGGIEIVA